MTISMRGYDSLLATPPADYHNEYAEEYAMDREHEEHMAALAVWIENATGQQIKTGMRLLQSAIDKRISDAAAELRALRGSGVKVPRAPRSDKGKPRAPKLAANDTAHADPFEVAR